MWNFNILNALCLIKFPSSTLSETIRWLSIELKQSTCIYLITYIKKLQQGFSGFKCSGILVCVAAQTIVWSMSFVNFLRIVFY